MSELKEIGGFLGKQFKKIDGLIENSGARYIPFDFTKGRTERRAEVLNFLKGSISEEGFFDKPLYAKVTYKTDQNATGVTTVIVLLENTETSKEFRRLEGIISNVYDQEGRYNGKCIKIGFAIDHEWDEELTYTENFYYDASHPVFFLAISGAHDHGVITVADNNLSRLNMGDEWGKIGDYYKRTPYPPVIMLYTGTSGTFIPAQVSLKREGEGENVTVSGNITIEYIKEADNGKQFIRECFIFDKATMGNTAAYIRQYTVIPLSEEIIVVPYDFSKTYEERKAEVCSFVLPYYENNKIYTKPVYAKVTNFVGNNSYAFFVPLQNETKSALLTGRFKGVVKSVYDSENAYKGRDVSIGFYKNKLSNSIELEESFYLPLGCIMNLALNTDSAAGNLSVSEDNLSISRSGCKWGDFMDYVTRTGTIPLINLYTPTAGMDVPAHNSLTITEAEGNTVISGSLEINYRKEIDGVMNLVTEKFTFPNLKGMGSSYSFETTSVPFLTPVVLVDEYPADLSGYADGTIFIKK